MKKFEIKYVDCSECEQEVLGESMREWYDALDPLEKAKYRIVVGRIYGRPYCNICCGEEETDVGSIIRKIRDWEEAEELNELDGEI